MEVKESTSFNMPELSQSARIIIVGGGTFGTSAAYFLAQKGYCNVIVLDRSSTPSPEAAGTDINKVIRSEYPSPLYARLAIEARKLWQDPQGLFSDLFHPSGWLIASSNESPPFVQQCIQSAITLNIEPPRPLSIQEIHTRWPELGGELLGWHSFYASTAAWVNAKEGLRRMALQAMKAGVQYISGEEGHATQLLFDKTSTCVGVRCANGSAYIGDRILLAVGAAVGTLLDLKGQIIAMGHTVGHIQLTLEEIKKYQNMPIIDHLEGGMLFPPQEDGIMKIAANHFVTNYAPSHLNVSLPRYRSDNPADGIPLTIETRLRTFMREVVPEIADREWVETRICWDGDTRDGHFLITSHPTHKNLDLAVGGSGHGFKFLPVLGRYIVDMMEGALDPDIVDCWKWRPEVQVKTDGVKLDDLNDMSGWV